MVSDETFAEQHADQWRGCGTGCKESHHETSFCSKCGQCFYCLMMADKDKKNKRVRHDEEYGTFVNCPCGANILWD